MLSSEIIAKAVTDYYDYLISQYCCVDNFYIARFYQKYEWSDKWEECIEIVECQDGVNVEFQRDFCEGQTEVKNVTILTLYEVGDILRDIGIVEAYRRERENEKK